MTALGTFRPTDRLLTAVLVALTAVTILLAAEAHVFCNLFCIHGTPMVEAEICASRA